MGKLFNSHSLSFDQVKIIDRYGNKYIASNYGFDPGVTIGTIGFGWVSPYRQPFVKIPDETTLKRRIEGESLELFVSPGLLGFSTSFGTGRINTWSAGIQIGVGVSYAETEWVDRYPDRAWQEAIDAELGGPFAVYRKDVENRP